MVATKRRFDANLQKVRISEGGAPKRVYVCTRCLEGREGHQGVTGPAAVVRRPEGETSVLVADPSLIRFRAVVESALAEFETRRREVNDLNVFPVADGDTGDNMALTLRAVLDELDRLSAQGDIDDIGRDEIVDSVARAALLGARGNSGVILSQLLRGAAEELISRPGELIDPVLVAAAMARAAERAYGSVREPAEGTILTVVREMAARIASEIAHMDEPRLHDRVDDDAQNAMIAEVLEAALRSGELSVARGPELLPILREAGVVDAGGYGLTVMFAGVIAALRGTEAPKLAHHTPARITHPQHESSTYRYCTNFAVTGTDLDPVIWNEPLEQLGDSVLVVGDRHTLKVHLHTDEPERATALFANAGEVSHLDVADMTEQVQQRSRAARRGGAGVRRARRGHRLGHAGAVRGPGRGGARRREHAEPVDLRAAGRHPRRPRRGRRRAPQLAERDHGRRARRRAGREDRPRRRLALDAGRPRRRRRARPVARRGGQRRGDARRARARPHRRGHGRRPRRRRGPLPPRRGGRLRRRAARRLGRAGGDARGRARRAGPRGRAADADRGRRRAARLRRRRRRSCPAASTSSSRAATSPPTGG